MQMRHAFLAALFLVCCGAAAPSPSPAPKRDPLMPHERIFQIDYIPALVASNAFSHGNVGTDIAFPHSTNQVRAAIEFSFVHVPFVAIGEFNQWSYPHNAGTVEVIGANGSTYIPAFTATEYDLGAQLGVRIAPYHWYAALSYLYHASNYGYPEMLGIGAGIEKLPDLERPFSLSGYVYYFPNMQNEDTFYDSTSGRAEPLSYRVVRYDVGATWTLRSRLFLNVGLIGTTWYNRTNAPTNASYFGPRVGLSTNL